MYLYRIVLFATIIVFAIASHAQGLTPTQRGDCPAPPPGTQPRITYAPLTAPAHYFAPDGGQAGIKFPFRLSVWRAPCPGHPDVSQAWVKLTDVVSAVTSPRMPIITIFQHGRRLGSLPSMINGPTWTGLISDADDLPPRDVHVQWAPFILVGRETVAFDPNAPFTLFIQPRDGPWGPTQVRVDVPSATTPGNIGLIPERIGGMWWNPDRPGWGLLIDRNEREVVFAGWLTFDDAGQSTWFVMPQGTANQAGVIIGAAYSPRGKPFSAAAPWTAPGTNMGTAVGQFSIRFDDNRSGTFTYEIGGVRHTEPIRRLVLPRLAQASCNSVGGFWYDSNRDGWGIGLEDPGGFESCPEHFSLLTYDEEGRTAWYFAALLPTGRSTFGAPHWFSGVRQRYAVKSGAMYRPTGPSYRTFHQGTALDIGLPLGSAEILWVTDGEVRSTVRIGPTEQAIDMRKFRFEY